MYQKAKYTKGFTLAEMIVVVGIIGLLSSVILFSVSQARESARDKTRLVDIEQLHLVFKLYQEGSNSFPADSSYDGGVEIGVGGDIDDDLELLQPSLPKDPKRDGSTYGYFYDTEFDCDGINRVVLYAAGFETLTGNANIDTVCSSHDGDGDEYIILLQ